MNNLPFTLHRRAELGYSTLAPVERDALLAAIAPLAKLPENLWPAAGAVRLDSADPLYFVRVDTSLRAIIRPTLEGRPEILDLVRHEFLERYFKGGRLTPAS